MDKVKSKLPAELLTASISDETNEEIRVLSGEINMHDKHSQVHYMVSLAEKKPLLIHGSSGTGKTYAARKIAEYFTNGNTKHIQSVQFHPSYTYEDFIYGYQPSQNTQGFEGVRGVFYSACHEALSDKESTYVFLIDELTRADVSTVFGEILSRLEYRQEQFKLKSGEWLEIPNNLRIIATANLRDKSVGGRALDRAVLERFRVIDFDENEPHGVLERWLVHAGLANNNQQASDGGSSGMEELSKPAEVLRLINKELQEHDPDLIVGAARLIPESVANITTMEEYWDYFGEHVQHYVFPMVKEELRGFGLGKKETEEVLENLDGILRQHAKDNSS